MKSKKHFKFFSLSPTPLFLHWIIRGKTTNSSIMGNLEVYLVIFVLSHVLTDKNVFIPQTKQSIWQCVLARQQEQL